MALNVSLLKVKRADAVSYSASNFSTVTLRDSDDRWIDTYITIFLEGAGHEDAAARIAALINEQVVRRDRPAPLPYENSATIPHDDGPTYDGPDDENEALRMETEQNISLGQAREAAEEERAHNEEDRLGREAHLRSVRRDDKPWTPHEDEIEEDVAEGRRDADGELV